nr:unnamed protein product [Callosobruchus analis]
MLFKVLCNGHEVEERRSDDPRYSPLWFGPRVGRKKRSDGLYKNIENEDAGVFMDFIKKNPWTVVTFGNGYCVYEYTYRRQEKTKVILTSHLLWYALIAFNT